MAYLRRTNDSHLSSDEIRDFRRLYKVLGGSLGKEANESPKLKKLYDLFRDLEDYERDYLTPTELCICVGTLLFLGGVLTAFYKMYMYLSSEEDRLIREFLRRHNDNSSEKDRLIREFLRRHNGNSGDNSSGNCNNGSVNNSSSSSGGNTKKE